MNVPFRQLLARDSSAGSSRAPVAAGLRRRVNQIMRRGADQVAAALVTAAVAAAATRAASAAPVPPAAPAAVASSLNAFEQQLSKECASLTAVAVKTSYGWGWADAKPADGATQPPVEQPPRGRKPATPRRVAKPAQVAKREEIDVRQTAAAGLVLYLAGEQLGDPALTRAATEAARALAGVQQASGQMPAVGILAANAGGRDEPSLVPSRAATCAAVALLSTVIQGSEQPDPRLTQAAKAAATWLATQQTPAGAWPVAHTPAGKKDATKLVRLDTPDYRDGTAALLLAAHALGDRAAGKRADDAVAALLAMRVRAGDERDGSLWVPGYRLTGEPMPKSADLPFALDTVSAQHSMQTLLAACLLGADPASAAGGVTPAASAAAPALSSAARALGALPRRATGWHRYYDVIARTPVADLEPKGDLAGGDLFANEDDAATAATADAAVLSEVLAAAREIDAAGLEKYLAGSESEDAVFWPQHRVAIMLCGLGHGALATQFPQTRAEVAAYVKANEGLWTFLDGSVPGDLGTRLERLQLLVVRSKLGHLK